MTSYLVRFQTNRLRILGLLSRDMIYLLCCLGKLGSYCIHLDSAGQLAANIFRSLASELARIEALSLRCDRIVSFRKGFVRDGQPTRQRFEEWENRQYRQALFSPCKCNSVSDGRILSMLSTSSETYNLKLEELLAAATRNILTMIVCFLATVAEQGASDKISPTMVKKIFDDVILGLTKYSSLRTRVSYPENSKKI